MGLIKALAGAIGGGLADQWLEVVEPSNMGQTTVCTPGVTVRKGDKRSSNTKGTEDFISNGSIIHVYDKQAMLLVDGGKIVDYTAEPGYYKVDNSSAPSLLNGELGATIKESFNRFRFGGVSPQAQKVYYINLQEVKGIKFGTVNPVNYFDNFYNAELFLRAHGTYSIEVVDPILFYGEVLPRNSAQVEFSDISAQFSSEFLSALQSAMNQMSADGIRISHVSSKSLELSRYMSGILDEDWSRMRGMEIRSVGIASISYDEESQKLINTRNQGAMLSDATIREGYVQGAVARGMEAAGGNANGAMAGFMGMGMASAMGEGVMGGFSQTNAAMMNRQAEAAKEKAADGWKCECGATNTGRFCSECGKAKPAPAGSWKCECGSVNTGKFCPECGKKAPDNGPWKCECGAANTGKFCSECGKAKP